MNYPRAVGVLAIMVIVCVITIPPASLAEFRQSGLPSQMVILNVRVTDPDGKAVADVPQDRFVVTEDGVPQKIALFNNKRIPLSYGLLIDSSGSLRSQFRSIVETGARIVNSNTPEDETFLVRFISSDKIETVQELTSDKAKLMEGLSSLYIEGGATAVIDAVYLGVDYLVKKKNDPDTLRRRVLVVVTDGEDRNSFYKMQHLVGFLSSTDVQIFAIGFTKELSGDKHDKAVKLLTLLTRETGGRAFFPSSTTELDRIAKEIIDDTRTQYVIGYVPSGDGSNKGFHKTLVSISDNPEQQKRVAITRVGYRTQ